MALFVSKFAWLIFLLTFYVMFKQIWCHTCRCCCHNWSSRFINDGLEKMVHLSWNHLMSPHFQALHPTLLHSYSLVLLVLYCHGWISWRIKISHLWSLAACRRGLYFQAMKLCHSGKRATSTPCSVSHECFFHFITHINCWKSNLLTLSWLNVYEIVKASRLCINWDIILCLI